MGGTLNELDSAMDAFDERKATQKRVTEQKAAEKKKFVEDFEGFRETIARPVFQEIGNYLKPRGHRFSISASKHHSSDEMSITLLVIPKGTEITGDHAYGSSRAAYPQFRISGDASTQTITLHGIGPGVTDPRGQHSLETMTAEQLRGAVVSCIAEFFSGKRSR